MDQPAQPPGRSSPPLPRNVKVLGFASLLNDIASEAIYPLLPYFLITFLGGNRFWLGVIEGTADSVSSFVKLWSGGRSDQSGRRKGFVVFGYFLATITRPLIGIISAPWQLLVIRSSDRIGKGIRTSPRDALIADSTEPQQRGWAFGFHRAMDHLGAGIGPLLAYGFLRLWPGQYQTLFLLTALPGLLVVGLLIFLLKEKPPTAPPSQRLQLTLAPFDRNFRIFLIALIVFTLGNASDVFLLERARETEVAVIELPILWFAFHVVKSTSNLFLGRAVDRFSPRPLILLGWFLYAAVYIAFALSTTAWQIWVFFLIYGLFYGFTEPAEKTLVANLAGSERKGLAYGWYNFAIGIATLPASVLFGALYHYFGALTAFGTGAGLALLAMVLLLGVRQPSESGMRNAECGM